MEERAQDPRDHAGGSETRRRAAAAGVQRFLHRRAQPRFRAVPHRMRPEVRDAILERRAGLDGRRIDGMGVVCIQYGCRHLRVSAERTPVTPFACRGKIDDFFLWCANHSSAATRKPVSSRACCSLVRNLRSSRSCLRGGVIFSDGMEVRLPAIQLRRHRTCARRRTACPACRILSRSNRCELPSTS